MRFHILMPYGSAGLKKVDFWISVVLVRFPNCVVKLMLRVCVFSRSAILAQQKRSGLESGRVGVRKGMGGQRTGTGVVDIASSSRMGVLF